MGYFVDNFECNNFILVRKRISKYKMYNTFFVGVGLTLQNQNVKKKIINFL